jgi:hypothetical protein
MDVGYLSLGVMSSPSTAASARPLANQRRGTGRPKGRFDPCLDWGLAERLYVNGESVVGRDGAHHVYPSLAEVARRIGTTKQNAHKHARHHGWPERRAAAQGRGVTSPLGASTVDASALPVPPVERPRSDPQAVVLEYLALFERQLRDGRVRADAVGDLDKAVRLLAFVRGQAESTKHVSHTVTLDMMQARHKAMRNLTSRVDDQIAGVLGQGISGTFDEGEVAETTAVHEDDEAAAVDPFD